MPQGGMHLHAVSKDEENQTTAALHNTNCHPRKCFSIYPGSQGAEVATHSHFPNTLRHPARVATR